MLRLDSNWARRSCSLRSHTATRLLESSRARASPLTSLAQNHAPAGIRTQVIAVRGQYDWPDYTTRAYRFTPRSVHQRASPASIPERSLRSRSVLHVTTFRGTPEHIASFYAPRISGVRPLYHQSLFFDSHESRLTVAFSRRRGDRSRAIMLPFRARSVLLRVRNRAC
jgi:hypothetical protein